MPKPNYDNPLCPYCHLPTSFNRNLPSGAKQYRCRRGCKNENGKTVTITDSDRPAFRLGEKSPTKLTQKEKEQRWKERDPEGYKAARKRIEQKRAAKLKATRQAKKKKD